MAPALLSGAPPARRGAGHSRPDGKPHAARRDVGNSEPAAIIRGLLSRARRAGRPVARRAGLDVAVAPGSGPNGRPGPGARGWPAGRLFSSASPRAKPGPRPFGEEAAGMASEGDARPPAVVGVDGSDQSVAALRWAVRYGAATGTPVRAVLAWHYPTAAGQPPVGHAPQAVTEQVESREAGILREAIAKAGADGS